MPQLGLQLYSIKEETAKDFFGTLIKVGRMGYDGVEFAGFFDADAKDLKQLLDDNNILPAGSHHGMGDLDSRLDAIMDYCNAIACPVIICPGFKVEGEHTFHNVADFFNRVGQACADHGLRFLYHLHGHEFVSYNGKTGMDIILQETDPSLVGFEMDTYWVERAGVSALQFLKDNGARIPFIHFKDFEDRDEWFDAEIGEGQLNTAEIIAEAQNFDVQWFVVEQEMYRIPMMESAAISARNLRGMMGA